MMQAGLEPAVLLAQPGDSEHLPGHGACIPVAPRILYVSPSQLYCALLSSAFLVGVWGDLAVPLVYHSNDCGISVSVEMVLKYRRLFSGERRTRKISPRRVFITDKYNTALNICHLSVRWVSFPADLF